MEKIPGKYINVRQEGKKYFLDYFAPNGVFCTVEMVYFSDPNMVSAHLRDLERDTKALSSETDPLKREELQRSIEVWMLMSRIPELYAAHCGGMPMEELFSQGGVRGKDQIKNQEIDVGGPKHKRVKQGVDKLLESLREVRPETTLEFAKKVYAKFTDDNYENVNTLYHYEGKK